jgi:hypothetical protein
MTFGAIKILDNKFISNNVVESIYPMGVLEVAAKLPLAELNGPLTDAVEESLEKSIRSTVDNGPEPPPNQP